MYDVTGIIKKWNSTFADAEHLTLCVCVCGYKNVSLMFVDFFMVIKREKQVGRELKDSVRGKSKFGTT